MFKISVLEDIKNLLILPANIVINNNKAIQPNAIAKMCQNRVFKYYCKYKNEPINSLN